MIRPATELDAIAIASIYNYYIENSTATFEENPLTASDILSRIEKVRLAGLHWLVAEQDEKILGYAYATKWNERAAYRHTVETSIYLSNVSLSAGWGTKLYSDLFSRLRSQSIHIAIGGITLPNPASIALHEKFGMEKVAHFKEVGFKFDQWLDVGYWQVQLNMNT